MGAALCLACAAIVGWRLTAAGKAFFPALFRPVDTAAFPGASGAALLGAAGRACPGNGGLTTAALAFPGVFVTACGAGVCTGAGFCSAGLPLMRGRRLPLVPGSEWLSCGLTAAGAGPGAAGLAGATGF